MLSKQRRRRIDLRAAVGKRKGRKRHGEGPLDPVRAFMAVNDTPRGKLRVGERFAHGTHACCRHMARLQEFLPFLRRSGRQDLAQQRGLAAVILIALVVGALDHVGAAEHRP